ncbi:spore coat protein [Mesobacillus foraminis]|uniref:spore coat protein n=1 Tax=Mesobacillus foraminis TaxID=279826 RepID=UPI0013CEE82A|nr:spore coat protein [Mesobacillus foraminis]
MRTRTMEYNNLVQMAGMHTGNGMATSRYIMRSQGFTPIYGLRNPETMTPAMGIEDIDDMDVALALLSTHKTCAGIKMKATLEMANPTLRRAIQMSANSCADMAHGAFQYANQKGYYQL